MPVRPVHCLSLQIISFSPIFLVGSPVGSPTPLFPLRQHTNDLLLRFSFAISTIKAPV